MTKKNLEWKFQTFFRVEHVCKKCDHINAFHGPYKGMERTLAWEKHNNEKRNLHPTPWDEGLLELSESYIFGFTSMEKLLRWFSGKDVRDDLVKRGYVVREYVGHVKQLKRQAILDVDRTWTLVRSHETAPLRKR